MGNLDINNIAFQKEIAKNIIVESEELLKTVNKNYLKFVDDYFESEKLLKSTTDFDGVFTHSQELAGIDSEIIKLLALKTSLTSLIEKNKERISYFDIKMKQNSISPISVTQKQLIKFFDDNKTTVDSENINNNENSKSYKIFVDNYLLNITNGELRFSDPENMKVIAGLDDAGMSALFSKYPTSIATLPVEILLDTKFRLRVLKYLANTVYEMKNTKTIFEINNYFGKILNVGKKNNLEFNDYIKEINNLYTVKIKNYLIEQHPNMKNIIDNKINCVSNSAYLPRELTYNSDVELIASLFDNLAE